MLLRLVSQHVRLRSHFPLWPGGIATHYFTPCQHKEVCCEQMTLNLHVLSYIKDHDGLGDNYLLWSYLCELPIEELWHPGPTATDSCVRRAHDAEAPLGDHGRRGAQGHATGCSRQGRRTTTRRTFVRLSRKEDVGRSKATTSPSTRARASWFAFH